MNDEKDSDEKLCKKKKDLCNKNKDDEQAVLSNEPCPGACTVRQSPCCVIKPDPVDPPECFTPFDYCAIQEPKPKPPKKECPTKTEKKLCISNKDK